MAPVRDRRTLTLYPRLQLAGHRVQEVIAVVADVEAEQIVGKKSVQQLALPRTNAEDLGCRPRDMPEMRERDVRPLRAEQARHQGEVVVVDPDGGRPGQFLEHGLAEPLVHGAIVFPVPGAKGRADVGDVAERPQRLIGIPVVIPVIPLLFFLGQPDAAERVARIVGRHHDTPVDVHDLPIGPAGTMGDPGAPCRLQDRIERSDEAARRTCPAEASAVHLVEVRLSVRHYEERRIAEPLINELLDRVRGPLMHGVKPPCV
jgi:hypothetical protein